MRVSRVVIGGIALGLLAAPDARSLSRDEKDRASSRAGAFAPRVGQAVRFDVSPPLHLLAQSPRPVAQPSKKEREIPIRRLVKPGMGKAPVAVEDPVVQSTLPPLLTPAPTLTFEGISNEDNFNVLGFRVLPPDTNGDVGPSDYVQTINLLFEVFTKTGTSRLGPLPISSLFAGFGGPCETTDDGDPIVLYDPLADRWLVSQFSFVGPPFHQCIALSQTGDPTGSYFRYDFAMPGEKFNDYPKFGVWPDAYYMTDNQFLGNSFAGGGAFAFDRARMLAGDPAASYIYFDLALLDPTIGGMLPSDLDGAPPPAGTPNYFVYFVADEFGDPADGLRMFEFRPNFANPPGSTFTERTESPVATAAFDPNLCNFSADCIGQPGTTAGLDALSDRLMYRLQYRNFGTHESLVVNHTVNNNPGGGNHAAVRYYELRRALPGGSFAVNEQATFAPDSRHRWMGSAAMDNDGNLAVAYSHSANAGGNFPSIRYAARLATDPPNGLFQGEAVMIAGTGSQTSTSGRWGDYSMLGVDPVNDCDFWFTSEFYTTDNTCPTTSGACFHTAIGSFVFPSCTPPPAPGTLQGTVRNAATTAPIAGALVQASGGFSRTTSGAGTYSMAIPAGTYSVTGSRFGYLPSTASGVAVASGGNTTQDLALVPVPILALSSAAVDDSGGNNNGVIDFNECVGLSIVLQNQGAAAATGVSATLSTTTPGVAVVSPGSPYPDIAAGGTGANTVPFRIDTSAGFVPGTIIDLALQVTTGQGPFSLALKLDTGTPDPAAATFSAAGPVPIPDDNPAGASLPLNVSGITTAISKVRATVYITHTFDADLTIQLIGPDGTTSTLAGGVGGSGDNFGTDCPADGNDTVFDDTAPTSILAGAAPFVGSFRPVGSLSAFKGKSGAAVNGTWTLKVADGFAIDTGNIECWSLSINGSLSTDGGGPCPSVQTPAALGVDVHSGAGTVSNLNGVFEPGESATVEPAWLNQDVIPRAVTGTASSFTGPPGATYTLDDASAGYGTIAPAATNNCFDAAGDCYRMTVSNPATRPVAHWDATFSEGLSTAINKVWTLHVGGSFTDVPTSHMFYRFIETIFHKGVTSGCGAAIYCPNTATKREQMAVFLLRSKLGGGYVPPPATGIFGDVPVNNFFAPWIEDLYNRGITSGCSASPLLYCPEAPVTRRQMAVFLLRTLLGSSYTPPACTNPTFADVACGDTFADWIYDLAARGITSGCGGGNYCPGSSVTRGQMAAFLTRTFSFRLYGP